MGKDELMGLFGFNPQRTETLFSTVKFHPKFQIFHEETSESKSNRKKSHANSLIVLCDYSKETGRGRLYGGSSVFRPAPFSLFALAQPINFSKFSVTERKTMPPCLMWLSVSVVFAKYCQFLKQKNFV